MTELLFPAPEPVIMPVATGQGYPLSRIFCVGRNYVAHAAEMGGEVDREAPWYFTKSTAAYCPDGACVPYPQGTANYHHEVELVVALGADAVEADDAGAEAAIYGYAVGLDMTRRDRQQDGKDNRRPWSLGKDVECSAPMGVITPKATFGALDGKQIRLSVNGQTRQSAPLTDMVWSPIEVIKHLSCYYHLGAGDVIMTGTPAGVGPVVAGDALHAQIDGLDALTHTIKR